MDIVIRLLFLFNIFCPCGTYSCRTHVCFNWKISSSELILTCKVDNLHLKVIIGDQYGNMQADCLPPRPFSKCDPYYKNGSITQNPKTNETIYIVKGKIDNYINGNWTCRHGTRKDVAYVEVTVLRIHDINKSIDCSHCVSQNYRNKTYPPGENCIHKALLTGTISVLASLIFSLCILPFVMIRFKTVDVCFIRICKCSYFIKQSKMILAWKRIFFGILTTVFLAFTVLLGWLDDKSCTSQWVVIGLGIVFGLINTLLFLQNNDSIGEGRHETLLQSIRPNEEEQAV
ncbi:uncharacterized protein LOC134683519 [Mytilus trossulus]|uniref:uncharacterized protein LOC134683519 n=1 Tax=Mytilus trossulus TaxID=6551 RepID=UPI0030064E29